ncbi:hypothetical protein BCT08_07760 [Vibrio splendidus]|nr:hypothetical protein BCT08_07760 [Vibrio splendidus]
MTRVLVKFLFWGVTLGVLQISGSYETKVKMLRVASKQETIFLVWLVCSFKKKIEDEGVLE